MPSTSSAARSAVRRLGHALVRALPRHELTRVLGKVAELPVTPALRTPLFQSYCALTGAAAEEAELNLDQYSSLDTFFTRQLRPGLRTWTKDPGLVLSPADGRVAQWGDGLASGQLLQAKGLHYSAAELIGEDASRFDGGAWATVYLSPADYHRVHAPVAMDVSRVCWLGNQLWPVNGLSVPFVRDLFVVNERVALIGSTHLAGEPVPVALVLVAATVVGGIELYHEALPFRRAHDGFVHRLELATPWTVSPEQPVGAFHLGSTAIILVGPGATKVPVLVSDPHLNAEEHPRVRVGQPLFCAGQDSVRRTR